ncbi:hypothetical protein MMC20_001841 [Loxospora ochrophaea]|nr:hypothetical protein [Loxospora ochrophaea]
MEVRRIGDALLRSRHSPLLAFLAPSIYSRPFTPKSILSQPAATNLTPKRCIHNAPARLQSQSTAAAEQPNADEGPQDLLPHQMEEPQGSTSSQGRATTQSRSREFRSEVEDLLTGLYPGGGPNKQPRTSLDDVIIARELDARDQRNTVRMRQGELALRRGELSARQGSVASSMVFPQTPSSSPTKETTAPQTSTGQSPLSPERRSTIRLDAFVGRSVEVKRGEGRDLGRALRFLDIKLAANKVKTDFYRQRFHERPGLKRKRLKSERWRKRFKEGFRATVAKVQKMRRQGW